MDLLHYTLILNGLTVYLLLILIVFYLIKKLSSNELETKWEWVKSLPPPSVMGEGGKKIHPILIRLFQISNKSNTFFLFFCWFFLLISSISATYSMYIIITYFDLISETYQNSKHLLTHKDISSYLYFWKKDV